MMEKMSFHQGTWHGWQKETEKLQGLTIIAAHKKTLASLKMQPEHPGQQASYGLAASARQVLGLKHLKLLKEK